MQRWEMGKRILYGTLISLLAVALLVAAYILGTMADRGEVTVVRSFEEEFQFVQVEQAFEGSDQIAVVNLDVGVELPSGRHVYHGVNAVRFPFDNFQTTSLSEARAGLEDNRFGAYIIIPANFSENVESLNAIPTRIQIEYRMSALLSGEEQKDVLYAVLRFGDMLNSGLSYMYLSSVLSEFHQVQDYSLQLMEHDQLTAESIAAIEAGDLVEMVRLPDLIRTEYNIPPLDITTNIELIGQVLMDLSDAYQGKIELNDEQLAILTNQGLMVSQELIRLISEVNAINILYDEDGDLILSDGQIALVNMLIQFNDNLLDVQVPGIRSTLSTVLNHSDYFREVLERSIGEHLDNLNRRIDQFPDPMPSLLVEGNSDDGFDIVSSEDNDNILLGFHLVSTPAYIDPGYQEAFSIIMDALLSSLNQPVEDVLASVDASEILSLSGLTPTQLLASTSSIPVEPHEARIDKYGEIEEVNNYILDPFRDFEYNVLTIENFRYNPYYFDTDGDQVVDEYGVGLTLEDLLDRFNDFIQARIDSLGGDIQGIYIPDVEEIVDTQVVVPLVNSAVQAQTTMTDRQQDEISLINTHVGHIGGFSPVSDAGVVGAAMSQVTANVNEMMNSIFENNLEHVELTMEVYSNTEEFVREVREAIFEATEVAHLLVEEGVLEAQELSYYLSNINQEVLEEFTRRLPYTRLGTVEFSTAYQFMVRPMELQRLDDGTSRQVAVRDGGPLPNIPQIIAPDRLDGFWRWYPVIFAATALIVGAAMVYLGRKKSKKGDEF